MSKTKTIWDKSMSSRKKIFFNSKHDRRMRRWSERAEWYSDMPLDIYAMCGLTDFVHILFPSKKYRHINYYAHLYTAEKTANKIFFSAKNLVTLYFIKIMKKSKEYLA